MKITRCLSVIVLAVFLYTFAAAQDITKKIDEFVVSEMQRQKIPGVALAVVKDGKPLLVKGYGFANIEHQIPVKPETIFQSGSVGKQFTATAIMMLIEEGKISLDEKIGTYLGDVPADWQNITIRHLLSHTGGLTDYPDEFDFRRDYNEDELLKRIRDVPVAFKPGEKWQYSNLGYVTLGILIHKVTGMFYGDFLRERIFKPLGMTSARVISEADIVPNRASGYRLDKGEIKNQQWVSPTLNTTADGSLYLNVIDMIKWDKALSGESLLKRSSLDTMWTAAKLNTGNSPEYGFAWAVKTVNGRRVVEHGGAWQGFKSHIARYIDSGLTVIVFANLAQANQTRIAHGVAAIVDPETRPRAIVDSEPSATVALKALLQRFIERRAAREDFSAELQKTLFDQRDRLFDHVATLGPIRTFDLLQRDAGKNETNYKYRVEYDSMTLTFAAGRSADGKIVRFELHPE